MSFIHANPRELNSTVDFTDPNASLVTESGFPLSLTFHDIPSEGGDTCSHADITSSLVQEYSLALSNLTSPEIQRAETNTLASQSPAEEDGNTLPASPRSVAFEISLSPAKPLPARLAYLRDKSPAHPSALQLFPTRHSSTTSPHRTVPARTPSRAHSRGSGAPSHPTPSHGYTASARTPSTAASASRQARAPSTSATSRIPRSTRSPANAGQPTFRSSPRARVGMGSPRARVAMPLTAGALRARAELPLSLYGAFAPLSPARTDYTHTHALKPQHTRTSTITHASNSTPVPASLLEPDLSPHKEDPVSAGESGRDNGRGPGHERGRGSRSRPRHAPTHSTTSLSTPPADQHPNTHPNTRAHANAQAHAHAHAHELLPSPSCSPARAPAPALRGRRPSLSSADSALFTPGEFAQAWARANADSGPRTSSRTRAQVHAPDVPRGAADQGHSHTADVGARTDTWGAADISTGTDATGSSAAGRAIAACGAAADSCAWEEGSTCAGAAPAPSQPQPQSPTVLRHVRDAPPVASPCARSVADSLDRAALALLDADSGSNGGGGSANDDNGNDNDYVDGWGDGLGERHGEGWSEEGEVKDYPTGGYGAGVDDGDYGDDDGNGDDDEPADADVAEASFASPRAPRTARYAAAPHTAQHTPAPRSKMRMPAAPHTHAHTHPRMHARRAAGARGDAAAGAADHVGRPVGEAEGRTGVGGVAAEASGSSGELLPIQSRPQAQTLLPAVLPSKEGIMLAVDALNDVDGASALPSDRALLTDAAHHSNGVVVATSSPRSLAHTLAEALALQRQLDAHTHASLANAHADADYAQQQALRAEGQRRREEAARRMAEAVCDARSGEGLRALAAARGAADEDWLLLNEGWTAQEPAGAAVEVGATDAAVRAVLRAGGEGRVGMHVALSGADRDAAFGNIPAGTAADSQRRHSPTSPRPTQHAQQHLPVTSSANVNSLGHPSASFPASPARATPLGSSHSSASTAATVIIAARGGEDVRGTAKHDNNGSGADVINGSPNRAAHKGARADGGMSLRTRASVLQSEVARLRGLLQAQEASVAAAAAAEERAATLERECVRLRSTVRELKRRRDKEPTEQPVDGSDGDAHATVDMDTATASTANTASEAALLAANARLEERLSVCEGIVGRLQQQLRDERSAREAAEAALSEERAAMAASQYAAEDERVRAAQEQARESAETASEAQERLARVEESERGWRERCAEAEEALAELQERVLNQNAAVARGAGHISGEEETGGARGPRGRDAERAGLLRRVSELEAQGQLMAVKLSSVRAEARAHYEKRLQQVEADWSARVHAAVQDARGLMEGGRELTRRASSNLAVERRGMLNRINVLQAKLISVSKERDTNANALTAARQSLAAREREAADAVARAAAMEVQAARLRDELLATHALLRANGLSVRADAAGTGADGFAGSADAHNLHAAAPLPPTRTQTAACSAIAEPSPALPALPPPSWPPAREDRHSYESAPGQKHESGYRYGHKASSPLHEDSHVDTSHARDELSQSTNTVHTLHPSSTVPALSGMWPEAASEAAEEGEPEGWRLQPGLPVLPCAESAAPHMHDYTPQTPHAAHQSRAARSNRHGGDQSNGHGDGSPPALTPARPSSHAHAPASRAAAATRTGNGTGTGVAATAREHSPPRSTRAPAPTRAHSASRAPRPRPLPSSLAADNTPAPARPSLRTPSAQPTRAHLRSGAGTVRATSVLKARSGNPVGFGSGAAVGRTPARAAPLSPRATTATSTSAKAGSPHSPARTAHRAAAVSPPRAGAASPHRGTGAASPASPRGAASRARVSSEAARGFSANDGWEAEEESSSPPTHRHSSATARPLPRSTSSATSPPASPSRSILRSLLPSLDALLTRPSSPPRSPRLAPPTSPTPTPSHAYAHAYGSTNGIASVNDQNGNSGVWGHSSHRPLPAHSAPVASVSPASRAPSGFRILATPTSPAALLPSPAALSSSALTPSHGPSPAFTLLPLHTSTAAAASASITGGSALDARLAAIRSRLASASATAFASASTASAAPVAVTSPSTASMTPTVLSHNTALHHPAAAPLAATRVWGVPAATNIPTPTTTAPFSTSPTSSSSSCSIAALRARLSSLSSSTPRPAPLPAPTTAPSTIYSTSHSTTSTATRAADVPLFPAASRNFSQAPTSTPAPAPAPAPASESAVSSLPTACYGIPTPALAGWRRTLWFSLVNAPAQTQRQTLAYLAASARRDARKRVNDAGAGGDASAGVPETVWQDLDAALTVLEEVHRVGSDDTAVATALRRAGDAWRVVLECEEKSHRKALKAVMQQ